MKIIILLVMLLSVSSCSSYFLKKKCEKKNWFDYGQSVALKGERLSSDTFYNSCKKEEADFNEMSADQGFKKGMNIYCSKEAPYNYGKQGKVYNFDFCDHTYVGKMKKQHLKGLRVYCRPSNGLPEGIKGKPYNKLCPMNMEAKFLVGFNKGRVKYLRTEVVEYKHKVRDIESNLREKKEDLREYKSDLKDLNYHHSSRAGRTAVITSAGQVFYVGRRNRSSFKNKEEIDAERRRIEVEITGLERVIRKMRTKRSTVRASIRENEKEIVLLSE